MSPFTSGRKVNTVSTGTFTLSRNSPLIAMSRSRGTSARTGTTRCTGKRNCTGTVTSSGGNQRYTGACRRATVEISTS